MDSGTVNVDDPQLQTEHQEILDKDPEEEKPGSANSSQPASQAAENEDSCQTVASSSKTEEDSCQTIASSSHDDQDLDEDGQDDDDDESVDLEDYQYDNDEYDYHGHGIVTGIKGSHWKRDRVKKKPEKKKKKKK